MNIEYVCKLCQRPGTATLGSDNCEAHWIETFRKMLVCNPCADRRDRFKDAEERIYRACKLLARIPMTRPSPDDEAKLRRNCRAALMLSTRAYATVMAEYRDLAEIMWHEDFVEQLMERPGHAGSILRQYRDGLRTLPKAARQAPPAHYRPTAPDP
jgi:hypothetical protein